MPSIRIADPADPRLADYRNVPDPELIRRRGMFVAEGRLVVRRLLAESALSARSLADVLAQRPELPVYVVPQDVMSGITGFNIHRGCLAIGERPQPVPWQDIVSGAAVVLLDSASADPLYRKAIRTSMGAALLVPFARAEPWPAVLHDLRQRGFAVIGMTPAESAVDIRATLDAVGGRPVAIVLGHEGEGLSRDTIDACEHHARIPIASGVDSLNVVAAAAIALYELRRA